MNSLGKVVSVFFMIILLFIVPLQDMARRADTMSQVYVSNETTEFVNTIKNKGYLTVEMYRRYIEAIDRTNNLYKVQIVHSHKIVEPVVNENETIEEGRYITRFFDTYQDEILEEFDKGEVYHFSQGDYINVTVKNRNKTLANQIFSLLSVKNVPTVEIFVTYGGLIRDEVR